MLLLQHRGLTPGQVAGAARLYWHFKYYNFKNIALLDGGNAAWIAALEDLTTEVRPVTTGNYEGRALKEGDKVEQLSSLAHWLLYQMASLTTSI